MQSSTQQPKYFLFKKDSVLVPAMEGQIRPLTEEEWESLGLTSCEIFTFSGQYFIAEINDYFEPATAFKWITLRSLFNQVGDGRFTYWSQASQILTWLRTHKFCGCCGSRTTLHHSELALICTPCKETFYPKISPCIIVLITKNEHILLARAAKFKKDLYSTLAGFIEIGESAEDAIHREINEEVSLRVKNISYFGSQAWPFPGQLMLGYFAEYDSGEIKPDGIEIMDAQWFHITDLPVFPIKETIAGQLIQTYVDTFQS